MERDNGTDQLHFRYVGLKELSRIELPSFESDMASAVRAVGGEQRIAEAIQLQQIPLQYNLTEGCIPSSVINATPVNKNGFLVRIRRERANPTNTTCELLGAVPKSYVFNALADYKFVDNSPAQSTPYVLNTPPSTICKESVNKGVQRLILQENAKRSTATKPPVGAPGEATNQADPAEAIDPVNPDANPRNPDKGLACFININDPTPQQHPRGEYPYDNERGIVLVKLLKKLFSIIPMLSREQIETYINLEGRVHLFKACLPYVAYCIVKGPFRQVWVRFGYDPKQHPESAIYQTIHFRVSPQVVKDVTERVGRKVGSTIGRSKMVDLDSLRVLDMPMNSVTYLLMNRPQDDPPIFVYNHVIKMQFIVQIYQLMDPSILQFIRHAPLLPSFDYTTGWFATDTLNTLRAMALKVLPDRINSFLALPDSVVWEQYHAKASGVTDGGDASAQQAATAALTGDFDPNEGARDFGFDQRSTGMFVDFNRTMNTIRAYLNRGHVQSRAATGATGATAGSSSSSSISSSPAGAGTLTAEGAAGLDPLHTADGLYCGKCIAWLRPYYAAVRQAMASAELGPAVPPPPPLSAASAAAPVSTKPPKKFAAKPPGRPKSTAPASAAQVGASSASARPAATRVTGGPAAYSTASAVAMQAVAAAAVARDASAFELLEDEDGSGSDDQGGGTSDSEEDDYYRA